MAFGTLVTFWEMVFFREKCVEISSNVSTVDAKPAFHPFLSGKGNGKFLIPSMRRLGLAS